MKRSGQKGLVEGARGVKSAHTLERFGNRVAHVGESISVLVSERADDGQNDIAKTILASFSMDSVEFGVVREAMCDQWYGGLCNRKVKVTAVRPTQQDEAAGSKFFTGAEMNVNTDIQDEAVGGQRDRIGEEA